MVKYKKCNIFIFTIWNKQHVFLENWVFNFIVTNNINIYLYTKHFSFPVQLQEFSEQLCN